MVESKGWDWKIADQGIWKEPAEDIYYYLHRWKDAGFETMLDLGCGPGRHAALFARNGFRVSALDISEYVIGEVKKTSAAAGLAVDAKAGDMLDMPYADSSFDCLVAFHSVSHTDTPGMDRVIGQIRRVLKPGGELFLTVCSKSAWHFDSPKCPRIDPNTTLISEGPELEVPHFHAGADDMKRLFSGFRILHLRHIEDIYDAFSSFHYFIHAQKRTE